VGKQVLVTLGDGASARDIVVEPIGNEQNLRYTDWEYTRRLETEKKGENKIGYLHLRAMGGNDINQFIREFTPVFDKQGLILDMRQNRGGNIDSWVLNTLSRKAWMYWKGRVGEPYWNMQGAFRGHMVMLVDHETASDGEAVADGFRRLGLGVVIGTRTWGGEIWLSGVNTLSDGGVARAPMNGVYGPEGKWLIEQEGLIPDIIVDNLPHATFNGKDAQLEAAIAYLQKKIAEDPRAVPAPPPYPKKAVKPIP
jgi:tricorn protease